uniref:Tetratricopeptide repeat containing protein n=1 Tax=uncultured Flavobacteriia bacterium TaxID=212695 RepID=H6RFI0_9BACT|nr:tetratricopeptide repeat containing protein [uncultured Flavobacteriia bacterium]
MRKVVLFCIIILVTVGCSTKKNTAINRFYHKTNSKFNPLFNGEEALRYGLLDITLNHDDNYWLRLYVDPYILPVAYESEDVKTNEFFDRAQDKAILTVQKHSMLIKGAQRNNQIARAYLLLGKARYYNGKYLQAIEAFTYLLKNMSKDDLAVEAELWRSKSYLALGQHERAARELINIAYTGSLTNEQYALSQAALADALLKEEKDSLATKPLRKAFATEKSAYKRGRYAYLLGQLYEDLNYADSAIVAYQYVLDLNRRLPRELWIHARLAQLKNNTPKDEATLKSYKRLLRSDEDRRFRDKIHYFYGTYLLKGADTVSAETELNASLQTKTNDTYLKSLIYEQLALNRLDQVAFVKAGTYLDSTLQNLKEGTRRFRKVTRQLKKLDDIIRYEKTITETDSLILLMNMPKEAQKAVVDAYIEKILADKEKAEAESKEGTAESIAMIGDFYFYNSRQVLNGKLRFQQNWTNIALADNWKYDPKKSIASGEETVEIEGVAKTIDSALDPETYLSQIPPPEALDSLQLLQNEAYYQAGLAYKEQFLIKAFAIDRFNSLLAANPAMHYIPPTLYHMYELYNDNPTEQSELRSRILAEYPESDYAKIIQTPDVLAQTFTDNQAAISAAKEKFKNQEFKAVIEESERFIPRLRDKELQAAWALLRATALGRLDGLEAYKKALTSLVRSYPKTEGSQKAQAQLDGFEVYNDSVLGAREKAKLVIVRTLEDREQSEADKAWLDTWLGEEGIEDLLRVSIDVFDRDVETLVIHGFLSLKSANEMAAILSKSNPRLLGSKNIVISASKYRNAFVSKRLEQLEN